MLENIEIELKRWDWKGQSIGDDNIPMTSIINKIERGYYKTKEVKLNIEVIDLATDSFTCDNLFEFMTHYKLVENADLKYPIIINNQGQIIDGRHRLCKAILQGKKEIKGIMVLDDNII